VKRHPLLVAFAILVLLTVYLTWPQAAVMNTSFAWHNDPHFSVWRLAWIAHALRSDPAHLFDGNIFYPARLTLAYSDATFLEGLAGAPLFYAGVPPLVVYNILLFAGFVASGMAMFVLARYLTGSTGGALIAAAIFTMVPYRIEHFGHLELQWAMWIPLALWAVHRTVDDPTWRRGALAGIFLWLQVLSCVYYGIFLAITMALLSMLLAGRVYLRRGDRLAAIVGWLTVGAVIAAVLTLPYARPYVENARLFGGRNLDEIRRFSATPISYLSAPAQSWLWGWTSDFGDMERRLFPGVVAVALAGIALASRSTKFVWMYAFIALVSVELSFGLHGYLYSWIYAHSSALKGLRAAARFSIIAFGALAVLAASGFAAIESRLRSEAARQSLLFGVLLLVAVEYGSAPMTLTPVPQRAASVYKTIRGLGRGPILELPLPHMDELPGHEAIYEFWSIEHWFPLVNGYSGYYPPDYFATILRMMVFPDAMSISRLQALGVKYIIVHADFYAPEEYKSLLRRMVERPELKAIGRFEDPVGVADLFELR